MEEEGCSIGWALQVLEDDRRVRRQGWSPEIKFVFFVRDWTYTDGRQDNYSNLGFVATLNTAGEVEPWVPTQTDLLSRDWVEVP